MKELLQLTSLPGIKFFGIFAIPIILIGMLFMVSAVFMTSYNSIMPYWTGIDKNNFKKMTYWESVSAVVLLWILGMLLFKGLII